MNSLKELNGYSTTLLSFEDLRSPAVIFDRDVGTNQVVWVGAGQDHEVPPGIEVVDIIQPNVMNTYIEINITQVPEATVEWPVIPTGCVVSNPDPGIYRIENIDTVEQWNIVKSPIIHIQDTTQDFYYYSFVKYEPGQEKYWGVIVNVGVIAQCDVTTALTATTSIFLNSIAQSDVSTTLAAFGGRLVRRTVNVESVSDMLIPGNNVYRAINQIDSTSLVDAVAISFHNFTDRTYDSNVPSLIFFNTPPSIQDTDEQVYTITLSCPDGHFGTTEDTTLAYSTLTYTAVTPVINELFKNIIFYPNKNFVGSTIMTYTQTRNGVYEGTLEMDLTFNLAGTIPTTSYSFTKEIPKFTAMTSTSMYYTDTPYTQSSWINDSSGIQGSLDVLWFKNIAIAVGASGSIKTSSTYGSSWVTRTSNTTETLNSVEKCAFKYVVVGTNGTILTSSYGDIWTSVSSGTTVTLNSSARSTNTSVIVGNAGTILTSYDNVTWTSRTSGTTQDLKDVCYDGSKFIAVGTSGTVLTSVDGVTWSSQTSNIVSNLTGVIFKNNIIVAYGTSVSSNSSIIYSTDGTTWNNASVTREIKDMSYSVGTFVGVSSTGYYLVSNDGMSWSSYQVSGGPNFITVYSTDKSWYPSAAEKEYCVFDYLVVGGGGGRGMLGYGESAGFVAGVYPYSGTSGGGGGQVVTGVSQAINDDSYQIKIGAAGASQYYVSGGCQGMSTNGGTSYLGSISAAGGQAGEAQPENNTVIKKGGTSGNGNIGGNNMFTAGIGIYGGGGGGSNGVGADASSSGALGGTGVISNITGPNVMYGNGGAGGGNLTSGTHYVRYGSGAQGLKGRTSLSTIPAVSDSAQSGIVIIKTRG